ncbi:hypothetical protein A5320_21080 [Rheinheimera sp. SA_1]|uniref:HvfC/BufC family peptide modification chaperone n=1 Tax=Rheinheimera sp. SA_1 TaxID=1827365 RepID=UPI0007FE6D4D|nr:putative DNA-binding domain-containing protein [Rheinheimera sp. SA_1]OBP17166.1 hypothetical protein A5320_21080 [Rheinheimera sp. SA_1]
MLAATEQADLLAAITSNQPASLPGIAIYQSNRLAIAVHALEISFPTVRALLGEGFAGAVQRFIQQHPLQSGDWGAWGGEFPHWLLQQTELLPFVYIAEMAEIDWQLFQLERSADPVPDPASFALIQQYQPTDIRFVLSPQIFLTTSGFPLSKIWQYHQLAAAPSLLQEIKSALSDETYHEYLVISRLHWKAQIHLLDPAAFNLLNMCRQGKSLSTLIAEIERLQLDFTEWLSSMLKFGVITGLCTTYNDHVHRS